MNLFLLFLLSGLLLQGIKLLFNNLTSLYKNQGEALFSNSDESMYANQLHTTRVHTIETDSQFAIVQKTTSNNERPAGKEVIMPTPLHQSA